MSESQDNADAAETQEVKSVGVGAAAASGTDYAINPGWIPDDGKDRAKLLQVVIFGLLVLAGMLVVGIICILIFTTKDIAALVAVLSTVVGGLIGLFVDSSSKS